MKKESGAEGRKRRKLEAEEAKTSSMPFFVRPAASSSTGHPAGLSESSEAEEEVKSEAIRSETATEVVDMIREEHSDGDESEPDNMEPSELDCAKEPQISMSEVIEKHDIGLLKFNKDSGRAILTDTMRTEIVQQGTTYFQNSEGPFLPTNNCSMTESWFKRRLGDGRGEEVPRSWLVYSPSKRSAFCICCLLFSQSDPQSSLEQESGFSQWRLPDRIRLHEHAKSHRVCFIQWKEMERTVAENRGVIDLALQSQGEKEKQRWRDILKRIIRCIQFLVTQNVTLQRLGESLQLDDVCSIGNALRLLELLAVFDPVIQEHPGYVESHPGAPSYFSPGIHDEFIHMMASTVRKSLMKRICKAKYYGLMFDTTSDLAHRDLMPEVVRYVDINVQENTVRVRETFLGFIQTSQEDAESSVEKLLKQLEEDGMDLQDCRSQCYDSAAVMAGHSSGINQRICGKNHLALFVNCDNHLLNLVGVQAAKQDPAMVTFFGIIDAIYAFFSRSTQCWEKLQSSMAEVVKSESEARWSARTEAVEPVSEYVEEILELLYQMAFIDNETSETKSDAEGLYDQMLTYQFLTLLGFWNHILTHIGRVQKRLQDPKRNFHDAALDLKALGDHFLHEREGLVRESLERGFGLCEEWNVAVERRVRCKKTMAGRCRDAGLTAKVAMERVMKETLDRLHREMDERFTRLQDTDSKFGFLLDTKGLCYGDDKENLKKNCANFAQFYSSDVDGEQLYEEIMDCRMLLSSRDNLRILRPEELLQFITKYGGDGVFPNLRNAVQIMLTIAVSSCERSFGKLKRILSCLRASMGQERLCDLALLSMEEEESEKTDFDDLINQFASVKARQISS